MAATLLMAGCSQNELMEVSPDANPAVGFGVYTGVQTKAGEMTINELKTGFGVFAYHTLQVDWTTAKTTATPNFMFDQKVTSANGTTWTYTPVKYWPTKEEKVTFFAYGPHSTISGSGITTTSKTDKAAPKLTFALSTNATTQVDLLVAKNDAAATQNRTFTTSGAGGVTLTFQHALSRLTFDAKPSEELATTTGAQGVTHVYVKNARVVGESASKFYNKGVFNCEDATWSGKVALTTGSYDLTGMLALADYKSVVTNAADQTSGAYKAVDLTSNATAKTLFTASQYLFLIPETAKTGAGTGAAGDVKIQFDYDIVTVDTQVSKGYTITHHQSTASLPTGALKQGTAYKYTITFGINKVVIATPTVEGWGAETSGGTTV